MIFIKFDEPIAEAIWSRWRNECDALRAALSAMPAEDTPPTVSNLYKRQSIKKAYYFNRSGPFGGKCAYCETYLVDFLRPDVEHYRPKLGVTDENDVPVVVDYGKGPAQHRGYYWLAYDWKNLLPSCAGCNQASEIDGDKIGKHNRFPVNGPHARFDAEIAAEQPLLLNPICEDPSPHLRVNTTDGIMEARNGSARGEMTIRVLGLTVRDQLRDRRFTIAARVKARLAKFLLSDDVHEREALVVELRAMRDGAGEHTAAVRAVFEELAPFFDLKD